MRELTTFFTEGVPISQNKLSVGRGGHIYHGNPKLLIWRATVGVAAQRALPTDWEPYAGACKLVAVYYFAQPKSNKNPFKVTAPDTGNLDKAIEDSLTGVVYVDDKQIVHHDTQKRWTDVEAGDLPGALIQVIGLE